MAKVSSAKESAAYTTAPTLSVRRLNALRIACQVHQFPTFQTDFRLTDVVLDLSSFPLTRSHIFSAHPPHKPGGGTDTGRGIAKRLLKKGPRIGTRILQRLHDAMRNFLSTFKSGGSKRATKPRIGATRLPGVCETIS
jgi:hypothetical protein